MIKKLKNQPYATKWEQAPKWEQRGREKNTNLVLENVPVSSQTVLKNIK
jgi:hypothetical protein